MQHLIDLAILVGGAGVIGLLALLKLRAAGVLDLDFTRPTRRPDRGTYVRWMVYSYERRDLTQQGDGAVPGYFGLVPIDVIAGSAAEAMEKARQIRPPTSDAFGYELKQVTELLRTP